jgi:hypothetical protein
MDEDKTAFCSCCAAIVPIVQPVIGRAIGSIAPVLGVQLLGKGGVKSLKGTLLIAGIGLLLGWIADQAMDAVCGRCGKAVNPGLA